ncbi:MAG TPA: hypothetical protein VK552_07775 [Reyranella sp.]|nr:hypothetical protein [Reyranella sp.]
MQHGIELLAHGRIDFGDVAVERRPQSAGGEETTKGLAKPRLQRARRIEAAVQERRQFCGWASVPLTEEAAGQDRLPQGPTRFDRRRALFDCRRGGTCYRHFVTHGVAGPAL